MKWKNISVKPRIIATDTATRMFHVKFEYFISRLIIFQIKKVSFPACYFCKLEEETVSHLFHECFIPFCSSWIHFIITLFLSQFLRYRVFFLHHLWIYKYKHWKWILINHLFLIFKMYVYFSSSTESWRLLFVKLKL